jgi:hypothetical protein
MRDVQCGSGQELDNTDCSVFSSVHQNLGHWIRGFRVGIEPALHLSRVIEAIKAPEGSSSVVA